MIEVCGAARLHHAAMRVSDWLFFVSVLPNEPVIMHWLPKRAMLPICNIQNVMAHVVTAWWLPMLGKMRLTVQYTSNIGNTIRAVTAILTVTA
jgi:hypothetical protein